MNEDLKFFSPMMEKTPMYISLTGITYPDASYHIRRKASNVTVVEYVTEGCGFVCHEGNTYPVEKDSIYLLCQGEAHDYYSDKDNPFTKIFMNVSGSFCERLISAYGLTGKHFFDGGGIKPLFERILHITHSDIPESEMQSALQGLFLEIVARISQTQTGAAHSDEAMALIRYLNANMDRIVSAKELSKVIFRSPDYCVKLFSREFQTTPYAYQLDRKLKMAQSLLTDTSIPVGEIARSLGYHDIHYFSNLFQEKCGCRPSSFRKNTR